MTTSDPTPWLTPLLRCPHTAQTLRWVTRDDILVLTKNSFDSTIQCGEKRISTHEIEGGYVTPDHQYLYLCHHGLKYLTREEAISCKKSVSDGD
jgi:hypothetical protein